jgi:diguanylate cyclase (GGDEF)-like protein
MSAGVGLWVSAQLLWTHFEVLLRKEVPNPFVGDILLVLHLVPIVAAIVIRPDKERPRSKLRTLDFVMLFSWWLYLYLFFVIPWQYIVPNTRVYGFAFDKVYFAGHVVILCATFGAWRSSAGLWRGLYLRLLLASWAYAVASIAASVAIDYDRYYTGSIYDVPLLFAEMLFVEAALFGWRTGSIANLTDVEANDAHPWVAFLTIGAAASLPLLAAWAEFVSSAPPKVTRYQLGLTFAMIVIAGALRSAKQYALDKELARRNADLREASLSDALTGVRNRRFLAGTIEKDVQQVLRFYSTGNAENRNRDLIFFLIDIDHFKLVNDRFGHQGGDALLVEVAARISSAIRYSDVLIRWGGEEFLVVSRFTDRESAEILTKRILQAIGGEEFQLASGRIRRTCSIGWAAFPWRPECPESVSHAEILQLADKALYEAKKGGRNMAIGLFPELATHPISSQRHTSRVSNPTLNARRLITRGPNPELTVTQISDRVSSD